VRIIPAIDIIDGKCVRLTQGDYAQQKTYHEDPLEVARSFEAAGLSYLHLVDLDGAKAGKVTNWRVVETITQNTGLQVDFGGGIKTEAEIERLLALGVKQVNLGSVAVKAEALVAGWISRFGNEKIILSADVKDEQVAIHGWQENSNVLLRDFIAGYLKRGIRYITCTDIQTDGMLSGPNTALYRKILSAYPDVKLIASGGVSGLQDLIDLHGTGVDGVIIGKAIYEGKIKLSDLTSF
jgi:phosphoribosylformimino-5-aminoimidazole carboxamide ribotide isomerase